MRETANLDLVGKIPAPDWDSIYRVIVAFNGYEHWGSFGQCSEIANTSAELYCQKKVLPKSPDELRTSLLYEASCWHHVGEDLDEQTLVFLHALIEEIRKRLLAREFE